MKTNQAKRRVADGRVVFGSFVFSAETAHVEILGLTGYDFAILDLEHAALSLREVERLVLAADAAGVTSIVRVPTQVPDLIGRVLDTGAQGLMLPHVKGRGEVLRISRAVRYPPDGIRGACTGVRAAGYTAIPFDLHVKQTAEEVWVLGLIEDAEAGAAIEEIVTSGLDVVIPGPADLSASLGVPGQFQHPSVTDMADRVMKAASGSGRAVAGMYVANPAHAEQWIRKGARVIVYGIDTRVMCDAYRRGIEQMRAFVPGP